MRVWVEVPDRWGWGPVRVLRTSLARDGYWTEEYRGTGCMLAITGSRPGPGAPMVSPPEWRGGSSRNAD
jgi:hypothetical protein